MMNFFKMCRIPSLYLISVARFAVNVQMMNGLVKIENSDCALFLKTRTLQTHAGCCFQLLLLHKVIISVKLTQPPTNKYSFCGLDNNLFSSNASIAELSSLLLSLNTMPAMTIDAVGGVIHSIWNKVSSPFYWPASSPY